MSGKVIAGLLLFVAVAIAAAVLRAVSKRQAAWQEAIVKLGLEPLDSLDPKLSEHILELYKPPQANPEAKTKWTFARVLRSRDPAADCYLLNVLCEKTEWIQARGGQAVRTQITEERIVAQLSKGRLNAPRIDILPKAVVPDPGSSRLAAVIAAAGNAILDGVSASDAMRVDFADDPEFERRYLVRAPKINPAREYLDSARRNALLALDGVRVTIDDSLLLVSSSVHRIKRRGRPLAEQLAAELAQAKRVLVIFSSGT